MTNTASQSYDIGATTVSPLIAAKTCTLRSNVTDLLFSPNGKSFYAALGDGTIQQVSFESAEGASTTLSAVKMVFGHKGAVTHLSSLKDDIISAGQDGHVVIHSAEATSDPIILFDGAGSWINTLAVHEKSGRIAVSCDDTVHVVDASGALITKLSGFPSTVSDLAFDSGGTRIAVSHYDGVSIRKIDELAPPQSLDWKGSHTGVSWSPDDKYIVSTTQERELHIWNLDSGKDFRMGGYPRKIHQMDWLPGGSILACSGADVITAWSFSGGPQNKPPIEIGYVFGGTVTAVAAHPIKPYIAGGFSTGGVMIGGIQKGEARVAKPASGSRVTALAWSPDGENLVAANEQGEISCFTLAADFDVK